MKTSLANLDVSQLPSLPAAAVRLLELSQSPDSTIQEICDTIRSDPAIAARVIKAANSSYFALRHEVTSIEKAACLLGQGVLTTITLTFCVANESIADASLARHFKDFWLKAVVRAAAADRILIRKGIRSNSAFLAGLLCDIGHLAALKVDPEGFARVATLADESTAAILKAEAQEFGIDHVELGVILAERWQLPTTIVDSIRYHHSESAVFSGLDELQDVATVKAAAISATVAEQFDCQLEASGELWRELTAMASDLFDLNEDEMAELMQEIHDGVHELSSLFEIDATRLPAPAELVAQAQAQLIERSVQAQLVTQEATLENRQLQQANEQLAQKNEALQDRLIKDELTQVYTRSFFDECLQNELQRCVRGNKPISVAFCDIDHFKGINDRYGHQFGDEVLRSVAGVLRSAVRQHDVLARYGGEEFVVVFPDMDSEQVAIVIERMRKTIEAQQFAINRSHLRVSVSIGAATIGPGQTYAVDLADRIIVEADMAMYQAKHSGRNQTRTRMLLSPPAPIPSQNIPATDSCEVAAK